MQINIPHPIPIDTLPYMPLLHRLERVLAGPLALLLAGREGQPDTDGRGTSETGKL